MTWEPMELESSAQGALSRVSRLSFLLCRRQATTTYLSIFGLFPAVCKPNP